jgi:hypothetical protein
MAARRRRFHRRGRGRLAGPALFEIRARTNHRPARRPGALQKLLRLAVADAAVLQRGGHAGDWLQLERDRLEFHRQKHRDALAAAQTEIQKLRDPKLPLSDADRQAIIDKADEILGLK